jgi:cytidine deaminase
VITGSYCENAAFNPSLSPLQAALVNLAARGKKYSQITRAVLVERQRMTSQVMQGSVTKLLLEAVAPEVKLEICYARVT